MPNYRYLENSKEDLEPTPPPFLFPQSTRIKFEVCDPPSPAQLPAHAVKQEPRSGPGFDIPGPASTVNRQQWSHSATKNGSLGYVDSTQHESSLSQHRSPEQDLYSREGTGSSSERSRHIPGLLPMQMSIATVSEPSTACPAPTHGWSAGPTISTPMRDYSADLRYHAHPAGNRGVEAPSSNKDPSSAGQNIVPTPGPLSQRRGRRLENPGQTFLLAVIKHTNGNPNIDWSAVAQDLGMSQGGARNKYRAVLKDLGVFKDKSGRRSSNMTAKEPHPTLVSAEQGCRQVPSTSAETQAKPHIQARVTAPTHSATGTIEHD